MAKKGAGARTARGQVYREVSRRALAILLTVSMLMQNVAYAGQWGARLALADEVTDEQYEETYVADTSENEDSTDVELGDETGELQDGEVDPVEVANSQDEDVTPDDPVEPSEPSEDDAPATDDTPTEPNATYLLDVETGLEAVRVEGEAAESEEAAAEALAQLDGVTDEQAVEAAAMLFLQASDDPNDPDYIGPIEDDEWERSLDGSNIESISATWVTPDTVNNDRDTLLYVRPADDEDQEVTLKVNYSLSGERGYAPGEVTITIPANIFKDARGKDYGTSTVPFAKEPLTTSDFNWKLINDGAEYVLTNTVYFQAATTGHFQVSFKDLTPHDLVDMQESAPFRARIQVTTNKGNTIGLKSNQLTAQFDTEAKVIDTSKRSYGTPSRVPADQIPESQRIEGEEE